MGSCAAEPAADSALVLPQGMMCAADVRSPWIASPNGVAPHSTSFIPDAVVCPNIALVDTAVPETSTTIELAGLAARDLAKTTAVSPLQSVSGAGADPVPPPRRRLERAQG